MHTHHLHATGSMSSVPHDPHRLVFLQADSTPARFHHFDLRSVPLTSKIVPIPYQFRNKGNCDSIIVDIKLSGIPAKALFVKGILNCVNI